MTDTPRTDAAIVWGCNEMAFGHFVSAEFARGLERELADAKMALMWTATVFADYVAARALDAAKEPKP